MKTFIKRIAWKMQGIIDAEDLEQEMHLALASGRKAYQLVKGSAINLWRKEKRQTPEEAVDSEQIASIDENPEIQVRIIEFIESLTTREQFLLQSLIQGYHKKQIAKALRTSPSSVNRMVQNLKLKVKAYV